MDFSIRKRDIDKRRLDQVGRASVRPGRSDSIVKAKRAAQSWQANSQKSTTTRGGTGDRQPHPLIVRNQETRNE